MKPDDSTHCDGRDERRLIRDLKRGDAMAYAAIYHRYFQPLYTYSRQFTKSAHDAEDLVQDVFAKLWQSRENIRHEDSIKGLLFTVARNNLISTFRRMASAPALEDYMDHVNTLGREDASAIEYKEFVEQLERAIDTLPPAQQRVFRMSRLEYLSNNEIADRLGINEQSVKNSLSQALKQLRAHLKYLLIAVLLFLC